MSHIRLVLTTKLFMSDTFIKRWGLDPKIFTICYKKQEYIVQNVNTKGLED